MFQNKQKILLVMAALAVSFLFVRPTRAAETRCLCTDDVAKITAENYKTIADTVISSGCLPQIPPIIFPAGCNNDAIKRPDGQRYSQPCQTYDNQTKCEDAADIWLKQKEARIKSADQTSAGSEGFLDSVIPKCLFDDVLTTECKDIGIFIVLLINFARWTFGILGTFALAYFIYGGFVLIMSQGNTEKVQKGRDIIMAAVIGLFIAFAAYMLIRFLGQAVGVEGQYLLKK